MTEHNVLITGGCGFIGANLVHYLVENTDWKITVLDNLTSGKKEYLDDISSSHLTFFKGDIRNKSDVREAMNNCEYVVNLAAQVGVIPSINDPFYDMDVNIKGTLTLLWEAVNQDVKRFVQASSAEPLGEQIMPLDETKVPQPLSPYGASKLACEGYCSAASFDLSTVVLRFSNVYGPWCENKGSVIPLFIRQILNNEPITIYGDGNQTRDFVHSQDIAQGIYLGLSKELTDSFNLFQLGTGKETSINSLFEMLSELFDDDIKIKHASSRKGEIFRNYTSIEKARKMLDFDPKINLVMGLDNAKKWIGKHRC